jgi:hypothetical protein
MTPALYDPSAPEGGRWSRDGLLASTIPRMYHSSATLLPDGQYSSVHISPFQLLIATPTGSILVSRSNPNSDYNVGPDITYPTEYRVERFYPSYYNQQRPAPVGLPQQLSYGGPFFDVSLSSDDLSGDINNAQDAMVVILRTGFSTHTMVGRRWMARLPY